MTLGDWLTSTEQRYARSKVALGQVATNAHDEALYLLLRTLDLPLDSEARVLARKLSAANQAKLDAVLHRRLVERVPAAYLTREAWLGEHRFYVDERVIIPRSYFLEIIPQLGCRAGSPNPAVRTARPDQKKAGFGDPTLQPSVRRVADVCTGSGCLAILLAHHFPGATVDACDLSADALAVADINVREHGLTRRVKLFQSDVFDAVPAVKYDLILSNPPYEPSALVDAQAPEFAAEPRMAHDGGVDGLAIVRKLLAQARTRLAPHGIVVIEVGGLRAAIDREFAALQPQWLPTEDGSDCVCLFQAERLRRAAR
ncbi:MAG: 50S ribosomal protein L3 N(5)-glutamine methyltransferase [Verrucomicrobia bacterium]|nr:50S ribosomal protein L3 N(5)-glutamine methyltransferase [Verrucomicrobiota bacterium]